MNNKIDTILFDLDGTLIDTNELIIRSFLHTLNHYFPDQYKREDVLPFIGPTLTETFQSINPEKLDEMVKMYREYNWKEHDSLVTEFDGVYETVKKLKEHGFRLGIVTTKIYEVVLKGLQLTKLEPFFDVVVALDHVQKAKPDPEPIFKALELLGSKPENAIMVGDNYHDIMAGKNAGTKTAGVAWAIKGKASLLKYDPDYMLENMRDLLPIVGAESE